MLPASAFISDKVEEREVELADGTTSTLYFRHLPNTAFEKFAMWSNSRDEDVAASASTRLLALGLCEADGSPVLTAEQAATLKRPIVQRLVRALLDVNGYAAAKAPAEGKLPNASPSAAPTGSGTS